ncbi:MAG: SH3 domain-containing protein [Gaiellaceae bacterium]
MQTGGPRRVRAYDTTELAANEGEIVSVTELDDEGGWLLCSNATGESGWLPIRSVKPV